MVKFLSHVEIQRQDAAEAIEQQRRQEAAGEKLAFQHAQTSAMEGGAAEPQAEPADAPTPQTYVRDQPKVGRNEPCHCGSGKKFKQCCGKL